MIWADKFNIPKFKIWFYYNWLWECVEGFRDDSTWYKLGGRVQGLKILDLHVFAENLTYKLMCCIVLCTYSSFGGVTWKQHNIFCLFPVDACGWVMYNLKWRRPWKSSAFRALRGPVLFLETCDKPSFLFHLLFCDILKNKMIYDKHNTVLIVGPFFQFCDCLHTNIMLCDPPGKDQSPHTVQVQYR